MKKLLFFLIVAIVSSGLIHAGTIKIIFPAAGDCLILKEGVTIKWDEANVTKKVKLTLWQNNIRKGLIKAYISPGARSCPWKVGQIIVNGLEKFVDPGSGFEIKAKERNVSVFGRGGKFNIRGKSIDMGSMSGQNLKLGSRKILKWHTTGINSKVRLKLFKKIKNRLSYMGNIKQNIASTGGCFKPKAHSWEIGKYEGGMLKPESLGSSNCFVIGVETMDGRFSNNSDCFTIYTDEEKEYKIPFGEAMQFAGSNGFQHSQAGMDAYTKTFCDFQNFKGKRITLHGIEKKRKVLGAKGEFVIFKGRELNPGWKFVSIDYNTLWSDSFTSDQGGYRFLTKPSPGSRHISIKFHVWREAQLNPIQNVRDIIGNILTPGSNKDWSMFNWIQFDAITLKGPIGSDWKNAFR